MGKTVGINSGLLCKEDKQMKKVIATILSFALVVSFTMPAFATHVQENDDGQKITETEEYRVVTTSDEKYMYSTTYFFESGRFNFMKTDRDTGKTVFTYASTSVNNSRATTTEETFTGYAYYITETSGGTEYKLNMPAAEYNANARDLLVDTVYFKAYYTSENRSLLSEFRSAVDALDDLEKAFIVASGAAIGKDVMNLFAWATATGPITSALISSLLGALGLTAAQYAAAEALATGTNRCYYAWKDAFAECKGIFY